MKTEFTSLKLPPASLNTVTRPTQFKNKFLSFSILPFMANCLSSLQMLMPKSLQHISLAKRSCTPISELLSESMTVQVGITSVAITGIIVSSIVCSPLATGTLSTLAVCVMAAGWMQRKNKELALFAPTSKTQQQTLNRELKKYDDLFSEKHQLEETHHRLQTQYSALEEQHRAFCTQFAQHAQLTTSSSTPTPTPTPALQAAALQAAATHTDLQYDSLKKQITNLKAQLAVIAMLQSQQKEIIEQSESLEVQLSIAIRLENAQDKKIEQLTRQLASFQTFHQNLRDEARRLHNEIKQLRNEIKQFKSDDTLAQNVFTSEKLTHQLFEEKAQLQQCINLLNTEYEKATSQITQLKCQVQQNEKMAATSNDAGSQPHPLSQNHTELHAQLIHELQIANTTIAQQQADLHTFKETKENFQAIRESLLKTISTIANQDVTAAITIIDNNRPILAMLLKKEEMEQLTTLMQLQSINAYENK